MKFNEFKYERPNYEEIKELLNNYLDKLEKASNKDEFISIFNKIQKINDDIHTMSTLSFIRHSINTKDEFYDQENNYWDEYNPLYQVFYSRISKISLACPFKEELYDNIPETYFKLSECANKSFDEKIVPLLQEENKLVSEYNKLKAGAQIEYNGQIYNLSSISPLIESLDEEERKNAYNARLKFFEDNENNFDRIYDDLVKVRTKMAKELGYDTYTELGYYRMYRLDYNQEMVANYRKQILNDLVPYASELYKRQAKRLNKDDIVYYNEKIEFLNGNPKPKGNKDELVEAAKNMYHEMSKETKQFIDVMVEGDLWDLESKDGKEMGGYCSSIPNYKVPFIFANFNGTSGDVDVLTHEAGHAFQYYMSRNIAVTDLQWPTMESAEIASMSMEFNAWPWMKSFFKEDEDKYKFLHLSGTIKFLPYGVLIDHFQHEIYNHPEMSIEERKKCYRDLEKIYLPHKNYDGAPILEKGCWWYQQGHIFASPFYYIDYTLAQVCALSFWARNYHNDPDAWKDYLNLVSLGGTKTFTGLLKAANLDIPFVDGTIKKIVEAVKEYLDNVDDIDL